jgi:hypothetical protein
MFNLLICKQRDVNMNFRHIVVVFLIGFTPLIYGSSYITYIPIAVGDITIVIPYYDHDVNNDGKPDYDDPSIPPQDVFASFAGALITGDPDTAVNFINIDKQDRYLQAFQDLGPIAGKILSDITNTVILSSTESTMEIGVNREVNGVLKGNIIRLVKGVDGVWRITDL